MWPPTVWARARAKLAVPKSASASGWQNDVPSHCDGASTIQSAEVTSIGEACTVRVNVVRRVRSLRVRVTRWPSMITLAFMTSPGSTRIRMLRDGAGTSSFQALDTTLPRALQSTSVPICSSALEFTLKPPSPTHTDEYVR